MARTSCNTDCWIKNPLNGGKRAICKGNKACACDVCSSLSATPFLQDGCIDACNDKNNRPTSTLDYLKRISPDILFNNYGILLDEIGDTAQGKVQAQKKADDALFKNLQVGLFGMMLIGFGIVIYKRLF